MRGRWNFKYLRLGLVQCIFIILKHSYKIIVHCRTVTIIIIFTIAQYFRCIYYAT